MDEDFEKIPREREESLCPCKSRMSYKDCCMPYHYGRAQAETAEQLMRSRYSAYFFRRTDYLVEIFGWEGLKVGVKGLSRFVLGRIQASGIPFLIFAKKAEEFLK